MNQDDAQDAKRILQARHDVAEVNVLMGGIEVQNSMGQFKRFSSTHDAIEWLNQGIDPNEDLRRPYRG